MTDTAPGLPRLGTTLFSLSLEQRKPGRDFQPAIADRGRDATGERARCGLAAHECDVAKRRAVAKKSRYQFLVHQLARMPRRVN